LHRIVSFDWRQYVVYIAFFVIFMAFAITQSDIGFLSTTNLLNVVSQAANISIVAVAATFVIGAAEIDLSVGAVAGLASVMTALAINRYGLVAGVAGGLLTGVAVGLVNGFLVTGIRIPSFLVTLGTLGIAEGAGRWVTNAAPVPITDEAFNNFFGSGFLGPVPSLVVWTLLVLAIGHVVLRKTTFGRHVLATGGNETATRFSGINTDRIKYSVMLLSSTVAALSGILYAGRLQSGRFQWGSGDLLSVIAAVIIGGTSLFGGSASVVGAVVGSLLISLINNGLILMGLEASQQEVARGIIIISAVALGKRRLTA